MADDFYEPPLSNSTPSSSGLFSDFRSSILAAPLAVLVSVALAPVLIIITTRLLSGRASVKIEGKNERTVAMSPYWIPILGHAFRFMSDPIKLMSEARDQSAHGIFSLKIGGTTHNVVSDPVLVKGVMQQKESSVQTFPIGWSICERFFGIPRRSKAKYLVHWDELLSYTSYLMKEPYLSKMLERTIRGFEENIPQMISFAESQVDQHSWERWAKASYTSDSVTEINLMSLVRDMMGHASVPGIFGRGLMEKYPDILHDVYDMDLGFIYFFIGLPAWTPWPAVNRAHRARYKVWLALDDYHRALDASAGGDPFDSTWGDLEDVSEFILKRHKLFQEGGFEITERGDVVMLWALVVNSNVLVYWHILHILTTPGLAERIRQEIAPYAEVSKPVSIGTFSTAPTLKISHEDLAKKCPLFKSTYFETLRVCDQPWSVRQVAKEVIISEDRTSNDPVSFVLRKGEYITVPHNLHMRDPRYFKDPKKFDPERFLVHKEDGTVSVDMGTIRPYGGGPSMCKGRIFAERECLAFVAGVLMFWDIEPADSKVGWAIPKEKKASGISLPATDSRVRIKQRNFHWEA